MPVPALVVQHDDRIDLENSNNANRQLNVENLSNDNLGESTSNNESLESDNENLSNDNSSHDTNTVELTSDASAAAATAVTDFVNATETASVQNAIAQNTQKPIHEAKNVFEPLQMDGADGR